MAGIDNNTLLYLRGDSFNDLSPNPKDITNNGVVIEERNLKFGGGYMTSPNPFANINEFTIEFCINLSSSNTDYSGIIGCASSEISDIDNFEIYFFKSSPSIRIHYRTITKTVNFNSYLDKMTHLAFVKKDNKLNIFVDGILNQTYSDANITFNSSNLLRFGRIRDNTISPICTMRNIRISNIARYTEDFTPPTQPYNSITINKTNQTDTNIEFNIEKLGQETINKVEVLVNGIVSETYTDNYDNIDYLIDAELCNIGNNDITIRVTFDDVYTEELLLTHKVTIDKLPIETPLLDTVERVKLLTKSRQNEKTMLSSILTSKNVEVSEEDKMSDLIGKVDLLGDYTEKLYLYKDGDECIDITGGIEILFKWEVANYGNESFGTKYSNYIRLEANGVTSQESGIGAYTANKIDLTEYSRLCFEYLSENFAHSYGVMFSASSDKPTSCYKGDNKVAYVFETKDPTNKITTLTIDISRITGSYYISGVARASGATTCNADLNIYKIWLEK